MSMSIEQIQQEERFLSLRPEWDALLIGLGDAASIFMSHGWYDCWWRHFSSGAPLNLITVRRRGELVGVAPLRLRRTLLHGLPVRCLDFPENWNSLHNDLLIGNDCREEVLEALVRFLDDNRSRWDVVSLRNIPEESENCVALVGLLERTKKPVLLRPSIASPFIEIDRDWDAFLAGRSSRVRKTLRNIQNTLQRAGSIEVVEITTWDGFLQVRQEVRQVARNSWTDELGDSLASPTNTGFFDDLARTMAQLGRLSLWLLRLEGRGIAFEFHLRGCGKQHAMRASFDKEFGHLSPGAYLEMQILRNVFERQDRVRRFDFGGNSDPYKKRWSDQARPLVTLQLFNECVYSRLCALHESRVVPLARGVRDRLRSGR